MTTEIILDDFQSTFSDLIDHERFEVIATEKKDTWVIRKKEPDTK